MYHRGRQDRRQLVIYNDREKEDILQAAHADNSGPGSGRPSTTAGGDPHNGVNTTLRKISELYWWRHLAEDVRSFCRNCPGCCHVASAMTVNTVMPMRDSLEGRVNEMLTSAWYRTVYYWLHLMTYAP